MTETNELIESFEKSLYRDDLSDVASDIGDVCIDLISTNSLLDTIPILGLLKGIYKSYKSISTARLIKKIGKFLFSTADISSEEKQRFIEKLSTEIVDRGSDDYINRVDNINKIDVLSNIIGAADNPCGRRLCTLT